jgi:7-carboxy-7-deazaguanine synthase
VKSHGKIIKTDVGEAMLPIFVNEIFGPTIQGEGPSAGMPCMFLRTSYCQLSCSFCDTPYTWNWIGTKFSHPDKYDKEKEVHKMTADEVLTRLGEISTPAMRVLPPVRALVISGGEPMLQQRRLMPVVSMLVLAGWWIEIETNGTVEPISAFTAMLDQINCSPKLSNSGDPLERRIKDKPLQALAADARTIFKFVVGSESDVDEVVQLVKRFSMKNVWLMPQARTKEELEQAYPQVALWGKQLGFNVSSRQHIAKWGTQRGV